MKRWTWLEWRGERAHYVEDSWPGCILVEFIDGERQIWPRDECRVLGAGATHSVPPSTEMETDSLDNPLDKIGAPRRKET